MYAHRCASNRNLGGLSPGAVAFRRDMYLNLPLIVDIHLLHKYRQHKIDEALVRANLKRIPHDYAVGEQVYKRTYHSSSQKSSPNISRTFHDPPCAYQQHSNNPNKWENTGKVVNQTSKARLTPSTATQITRAIIPTLLICIWFYSTTTRNTLHTTTVLLPTGFFPHYQSDSEIKLLCDFTSHPRWGRVSRTHHIQVPLKGLLSRSLNPYFHVTWPPGHLRVDSVHSSSHFSPSSFTGK